MKTELIKISSIKLNPDNPRTIKDDKFNKLVQSIKDFPEMLKIRPIVVNKELMILGGNMRLKACKEAGLKEVPIIRAENLTPEQQKEFIIKDNVGFGEWDWELMAEEWDNQELAEWGLDIPDFAIMPTNEELTQEEKNNLAILKITFVSPEQLQVAENDIQELIDNKYNGAYYSVSACEL